MNVDHFQSFGALVATCVCYLTAATELLLPNFARMSPDERNRAIVQYDEQIKANPEVAQLYLQRGSARIAAADFQGAIVDLDTVIRLDPDSPQAYVLRAAARTELKDLNQAIEDCNVVLNRHPDLHLAWFHRGHCWELKQEWDNAIHDLDQAAKLSTGHAATYRSRGKVHQARHEYSLAVADFSRALKIDPNDVATYIDRGLAWTSRRKANEAIADFTVAIRLEPDNAETYRRRSQLYFADEETEKAIADLNEAIRLEPNHAASYSNRGWLWHSQGDFDQSIADLDEAIRLDPNDPRPYLRRTNVYVARGEPGRALQDALQADLLDPRIIPNARMQELFHFVWSAANQKLIDLDDENGNTNFARVYRDRGLASGAMGDYDNAITDLTESIQRAPSSAVTYVARGQMRLKQQAWDKAIDDFNVALRLNPDDAAAWTSRGIAHAELKEWAQASDDFTEAIRLAPKSLRTFAHRAATWQALKEWDRAIADFEQVIDGGAIYTHTPRKLGPHETPTSADNASIAATDFAGTLNQESDITDSIRKIAGSQGEDFSQLFDASSDKSGEIFTDSAPLAGSNSHHDVNPSSANRIKQMGLSLTETTSNPVCLDPVYLSAFQHRAECWKAKHHWSKAATDYAELIRLSPSDPQVYRQLAWLKSTCPDPACRNGDDAIRYALEAAKRTHIPNAETMATLAAAYAEAGDFDKAIEVQDQAIELSSEHWSRILLARRKHFEAMEFQQTLDKGANEPSSDSLNAVKIAMASCEQSEWKDASRIELLADAYAAAGKFEDAIATQEKAHALNVAQTEKPLREHLELYRGGKPLREELLTE